ncbi:universal stress protein [mine drainage metagenome]|uniref:Universal stress protein n=1 Tax=mine drainage metagenome TaxID=410659 RepID=A0A1J5TMY5_9ZZZZ
MHILLVPVDGSTHSRNALKYAISIAKEHRDTEINIINVQPVLLPLGALPLPDTEAIEKSQFEQAKKVIRSACYLLDKADIKYTKHIAIGLTSTTIVNYAKDHGCDSIVMGTRGMGAFGNWVLGSTANQVVHLADMPVTLVK